MAGQRSRVGRQQRHPRPLTSASLVEAEAALVLARAALLSELVQTRMLRTFNVAAPGAGAEWSAVVPGGTIWELISVRYSFSTSGTVATRIPTIRVRDNDGVESARYLPGTSQAATLVIIYTAASGLPDATLTGFATSAIPSPAKMLLPGWTLDSVTGSIQAADAYTGIVVTVREWSAWNIQMLSEYEWEQAWAQPVSP